MATEFFLDSLRRQALRGVTLLIVHGNGIFLRFLAAKLVGFFDRQTDHSKFKQLVYPCDRVVTFKR
jgi:hypothetical protein